jgi:hypothetical protein
MPDQQLEDTTRRTAGSAPACADYATHIAPRDILPFARLRTRNTVFDEHDGLFLGPDHPGSKILLTTPTV